ncbi:hypothetical protein LMF32_00815 [Desemzia sp. C1]|uniref:hypothetical protein n=1 Tax=Desemzia sp. C1 TaxID=2892016 RepID=UPI001E5419D9|nr:hypothetical protein [Desemzia sp. C1]MCI3027677.1 hypothetical protein [Desemzia sp. C1]
MLTDAALKSYCEYTKRIISSAKYKVGATYYDAGIDRIEQTAGDTISIFLVINPPFSGDVTVSEVRLYDTGGEIWFRQAENISVKAYQEGVLYKFSFKFIGKAV